MVPNPNLKLMDQVREVLRRHVVDRGELIVDRAVPKRFGGQRTRGGPDPKSGVWGPQRGKAASEIKPAL